MHFNIIQYQSSMQNQAQQIDLIEDILIVGLDPDASLFKQQDRKILTSIQIVEHFQQPTQQFKMLQMTDGKFLRLGFNEKNYMPIIDIDIFQKTQGIWVPIVIPNAYQIFDEHIHVKVSRNWFFQKLIADVTIIRSGVECSFFRQIRKIVNKMVKIPYTEDYLVLEFHEVKPITNVQFKPFVIQQYPLDKREQYLINVPLFAFPFGIKLSYNLEPYKIHNFVLTQDQGIKLYCTCLIAMNQFCHYKHQLHDDFLYQPKGYIIVSKHQHTDCFIELLQNIYLQLSTKQNSLINIASKAWQQFSTFPLDLPKQQIQYPSISQRSFGCLFQMISVNNIVKIFKALLLEKNIFFVSSSKTILGFIIEAFLSLLYPLNWQHPVIPILLNQISEDVLDSPIPTIVGILSNNFKKQFQQFGLVVNIDRNELTNTKSIDHLITLEDRIFQRKLQKYSIYAPNIIEQFQYSEENPSFFKKSNIYPKFNIGKIRNIFLKYMKELLKDYTQYIIPQDIALKKKQSAQTRPSQSSRSFRDMFNIKQYKTKIKSQGKQHLQQFIETALFTTFIQRNCKNPQDPQFSYFNSMSLYGQKQYYQIQTQKTVTQQTIQMVSQRLFGNSKIKMNERRKITSMQYLTSKVQLTDKISDHLIQQNNNLLFYSQEKSMNEFSMLNNIKIHEMMIESHKEYNQKINEPIIYVMDQYLLTGKDKNIQNIQDRLLAEYASTENFGQQLCSMINSFSSCIITSGQNIVSWSKKYCNRIKEIKNNKIQPQTQNQIFVEEQ